MNVGKVLVYEELLKFFRKGKNIKKKKTISWLFNFDSQLENFYFAKEQKDVINNNLKL